MAIMTQCCCCDVRVGTMVVAIWSMMMALGGVITYIKAFASMYSYYADFRVTVPAKYPAYWSLMLVLHSGLGLTAALLPIGILRNKKALLLPYIAMMGATVLAYGCVVITTIVFVVRDNIILGILDFDFLSVVGPLTATGWRILYGFIAVVMFTMAIVGILCVICVLSQYQEMSAGRGQGRELPQVFATTQNVSYVGGQVNVVAQPPNVVYVGGQTYGAQPQNAVYVNQPPNAVQGVQQTWKPTY